jgi:UDP-N-acetylmuramate dehydrogenase
VLFRSIKLGKNERQNISTKVDNFLKEKRERQPLWELSAGCVFKNPQGMYAGRLIDEAGCKGMKVGDAEVSPVHANFFINKGSATAFDFIRLMEEVVYKVKDRFGVILEPEIKILGKK